MNRILCMIAAIALAVGVSGCSQHKGISLKPHEISEPVCADLSPVLVENLATDRTDCNLSGASITYPDGTLVETSEQAGSGNFTTGLSEYEYVWINVGNYGIVAGWFDEDCAQKDVWGSDQATTRVFEAYGEKWPCEPERDSGMFNR